MNLVPGQEVNYTLDDGSVVRRTISSGPKEMKHGLVVVFFKGQRGFFKANRCSPITEEAVEEV